MQASEAAELLNRIGLTNKTIPFLSRPFLVVSYLFFLSFSLTLSFLYIRMSFLAGGSADCGPVNPMSGLLKQFQQDRSLQQVIYKYIHINKISNIF